MHCGQGLARRKGWRPRSMRIGIDVTSWVNNRGYGRFTRQLVSAMARMAEGDELVLFIDKASARTAAISLPRSSVVEVPTNVAPSAAASSRGSRSAADIWRMSREVSRHDLDAFFFPTAYSWFPLIGGPPSVVTIHDAIAERFPEMVVPGFKARTFWRAKLKLAVLQARTVMTVSEFARRDVARYHGVPFDRIRVAVEAPSDAYRACPMSESETELASLGIDSRTGWFVYVGGLSPHKNVPRLVRAFARAVIGLENRPLLILSGPFDDDVFHTDRVSIADEIAALGIGSLVKWAGYLPDESLSRVLSGAIALVLPSECEGFGLPAVEAAACGTAVIATTESPLPQLLEGGGIFVDPADEDALTGAILRLAVDESLQGSMGAKAMERAQALSWDDAARAALRAIREAA